MEMYQTGEHSTRSYNIARKLPKESIGNKDPKCYYLAIDNSMRALRGMWVDWTEYGWFVLDEAKMALGYTLINGNWSKTCQTEN